MKKMGGSLSTPSWWTPHSREMNEVTETDDSTLTQVEHEWKHLMFAWRCVSLFLYLENYCVWSWVIRGLEMVIYFDIFNRDAVDSSIAAMATC